MATAALLTGLHFFISLVFCKESHGAILPHNKNRHLMAASPWTTLSSC